MLASMTISLGFYCWYSR